MRFFNLTVALLGMLAYGVLIPLLQAQPVPSSAMKGQMPHFLVNEKNSPPWLTVESFQSRGRLIFQVDQNHLPELQVDPKKKLTLFFPFFSWDEEAPPGQDWESLNAHCAKLFEKRLNRVRVVQKEKGLEVEADWLFPVGKFTLANPQMEVVSFHRGKEFIVDFWWKEGPTLEEAHENKKRKEFLSIIDRMKKIEEHRSVQEKEYQRKALELENVTRFCEQPLQEGQDIFFGFYSEQEIVPWSYWFPVQRPDIFWTYSFILSKKQEENPIQVQDELRSARKIFSLYQNHFLSLAVWSVRFFEKKFPNSPFLSQLLFLEINALVLLNQEEEVVKKIKKFYKTYPKTKMALFSAQYLLVKSLENPFLMSPFPVIEWLLKNTSDSLLELIYHLAQAQAFGEKSLDAAREYEWIVEKASASVKEKKNFDSFFKIQVSALLRLGNLYLDRMRYEQALAVYSKILSYFKEEAILHPLFYINRGETLYQLGQYEKAKEVFEEFLKNYPTHPKGWKATFRLGEIFGRKAQVGESGQSSRDFFEKTIQRYPHSPGATLARLRLIPCQDHGGFNQWTQRRFFREEAFSFLDDSEWVSPIMTKNYTDFRALARIRTVMALENPTETALMSIQELKRVHSGKVKNLLNQMTKIFFQKLIFRFLEENKKYEALSFFTRESDLIPKPETPFEGEYLLPLSKIAYEFGLAKLSEQLIDQYQKIQFKKEDPFFEEESLFISLKKSSLAFLNAKKIWLLKGVEEENFSNLEEMENYLKQVKEESNESFFKEVLLAMRFEKTKQKEKILSSLSKAQMICPSLKTCFRIENWIADVYKKQGSFEIAFQILDQLSKKLKKENFLKKSQEKDIFEKALDELILVPPFPKEEEVLVKQAEILEIQQKWDSLLTLYENWFNSGKEIEFASYHYFQLLEKRDKKNGSKKFLSVLEKLSKKMPEKIEKRGDFFWNQMAQEALLNQKVAETVMHVSSKEGKNGTHER